MTAKEPKPVSTSSSLKEKLKNLLARLKGLFKRHPTERTADAIPIDLSADEAKGQWLDRLYFAPSDSQQTLLSKLNYCLYLPSAATKSSEDNSRLALVVMLHGCKQDPNILAAGTKMNFLAESEGFAVLYPQQSISNNLAKCWRWYDLGVSQGVAEAHTIMSLIRSVVEEHNLDAERVYLVGMSAGGGMAGLVAANYPEFIRAVAVHSSPAFAVANNLKTSLELLKKGPNPSLKDPVESAKAFLKSKEESLPALIIHGLADNVVHRGNSQALVEQFKSLNGISSDTKATVSEHNTGSSTYKQSDYSLHRTPTVRLVEIEGLAHAWSGGDPRYAYHAAEGPQATTLIWDFFKQQ